MDDLNIHLSLTGADQVAAGAAKAADGVVKLGNAGAEAGGKQEQFLRTLREQIAELGKSSDDINRLRAAQLGIGQAAAPLILQLQNQRAAQALAAQAARDEAAAQREVAATKQRTQTLQQTFLQSLRDQAAVQDKSAADAMRYRAQQLGVAAEAEKYIAQLDKANVVTGKLGVSSAQTAAALRQLPAQFTDIVTSLQGGQAPLTVLLQQGGQIKDSFGGVGNALKATGSYALSLITPLTSVAAASALVVVAWKAGGDEAVGYSRAILSTGNAANTTVGQLKSLAQAQSNVIGTQSAAAKSLTALVATGQVSSEVLGSASESVTRFIRAGGGIDTIVKKFADLGRDPLKTLVSLNEAENFLTESVYKQVKALADQGRLTEAAAVAQKFYADVTKQRTQEIEQSLGLLEKAWNKIGDAAAKAWDRALNVGRTVTVRDQLEQARADLEGLDAKHAQQSRPVFGSSITTAAQDSAALGRRRAALEETVENLREQLRLESRSLANAKQRNDEEQARVKWLTESDKYLSKQQLAEKEITQVRRQGLEAGAKQAEIDARVASIRAKYADQGGDNELASLQARVKSVNDYIAALNRQGATARELNEGEKQAAQIREQLANSSLSATVRAEKGRALSLATELGQRQRLAESLKADIDLNSRAADQAGQQADSIRQQAAAQQAANQVFGQGKTAMEQLLLTQMKRQALDLEATDNIDPRYLANLHDKIAAQKEFVAALQGADFKTLAQASAEWLRSSQEAMSVMAQEPALANLSEAARARLIADRQTELKLAAELNKIDQSGLDDAAKYLLKLDAFAASVAELQKNGTAANAAALKELDEFLNPAKAQAFGDTLSGALAGVGNNLTKLSQGLREFAAQQRDITLKQSAVDLIEEPAKKLRAQLALNERAQLNQIGLYANMTGAAKGFFSEGSRGYKALEAAETAFRLVQLASDLQKGLSAAAVAIATQGQGDPYSAFPRMAAMAAAMAALGFAVGFSGGGSGGGGDGRPVNEGKGTVLGDADAKSESIGKSMDLLASTAKLQLTTQSGMLASLRNIESNIGGLAALVVRGSTLADTGVQQGTTVPFLNSAGLNLSLIGGTLAGPIGAAIGFAISKIPLVDKIVGALFGSKTKVTGQGLFADAASLSSIVTGGLSLKDYVDVNTTKKFLGVTYSNKSSTNYSPADAQLQQQFSQVFKDFYDAVLTSATPLGQALDTVKTRLDGFIVNIGKIDLSGLSGSQIQEKLSAVLGAAADGIAQAGVPGLQSFQKVGEGYFETLVRVASGVEVAKNDLDLLGIAAVNFSDVVRKQGDVATEIVRQSIAAYETVGGKLSSVGNLINLLDGSADDLASTYKALVDVRDVLVGMGKSGDTLTASLIQGAGGLDGLSSSLSTYISAFLSDQERASIAMSTVSAQFARIGVSTVPQSRDQFVALVKSIDTGTAAGQRLYAQVLGLAGAFDEAQKLAEKAATSVAAASKLPDILASQATERGGLMVELLKAQGDAAGAAALKRSQDLATLTAGLTATETELAIAGYDLNASLRQQIDATNAAALAAQQAAQAEAARAAERDGIQSAIDQLLGDTVAIRQRELSALDPVNRALKEHYYALLDEQKAAQDAAQASQNLAAQRDGIQSRIDELLGNTAAIRERELAALDPSNRALQEYYYKLLDQQKAAQEAAQAAEEQARAAQQLRDAWKSIGDTLLEEVARIRGLSLGANSQETLAETRARFAIATAQARAFDQDAAKLLPQISRTLSEQLTASATSRLELAREQAQMAASLEATANIVGASAVSAPAATATSAIDVQELLRQVAATAPITSAAAAAQQQSAVAVQDGMTALIQEVKALRAQVDSLITQAQRTAAAGEHTRDVLVRVTHNGQAMQTEPA